MGKDLHLYNTLSEHTNYINSSNYTEPYVGVIDGLTATVYYSKSIDVNPHTVSNIPYIQDGLIFYLDGIYKNSDTKWKDIINNIEFTSYDSVTRNNNCYTFTNGYLQGSGTILNSTNITVEVCYYTTKSTFFIFGISNANNYPIYYNAAGRITFMQKNSTYKSHTAQYNTVSINLDRCIANGKSIAKDGGTDYWTASGATNVIRIGKGTSGGANSNYFTGNLYSIRVYNRKLTQEEMLKNQQADNKRFNLGLSL